MLQCQCDSRNGADSAIVESAGIASRYLSLRRDNASGAGTQDRYIDLHRATFGAVRASPHTPAWRASLTAEPAGRVWRQHSSCYAAAAWRDEPEFRDSSTASTPMGLASTPRSAAATRSTPAIQRLVKEL